MRHLRAPFFALILLSGCVTPQQAARQEAQHHQDVADARRVDSLSALHPDSLSTADIAWLSQYAARRGADQHTVANRAAWNAVLTWAGIGLAVLFVWWGIAAS